MLENSSARNEASGTLKSISSQECNDGRVQVVYCALYIMAKLQRLQRRTAKMRWLLETAGKSE